MALSLCETRIDQHGRELLNHGTALFPAACYYDDLQRESVPWHWHDQWEVLLVTEGAATVATAAEKKIVKKGEGVFINSGVLHGAWNVDDSNCRFHSIVFHPRLVGGSLDSVFWQKYVEPLVENPMLKSVFLNSSSPWHAEARHVIEAAWQSCVCEPAGYEFLARAALSRLVFLLSTHQPATPVAPSAKALRDGARIKAMLQFIQERYGTELNTAMIAKSALISESECLRCFRSTIGVSPIQYVKQFRIQKAAELLRATDQSVADIGGQCGFQDISYFTKTFRELKGITPSAYRREPPNSPEKPGDKG